MSKFDKLLDCFFKFMFVNLLLAFIITFFILKTIRLTVVLLFKLVVRIVTIFLSVVIGGGISVRVSSQGRQIESS